MSESELAVVADNPSSNRYELHAGESLAGFAQYVRRGGRTFFVHTEIDPSFEGQGFGTALVRGALDHERAAGTLIVPLCPFVRTYIERHPEYSDLVDAPMVAKIDNEG